MLHPLSAHCLTFAPNIKPNSNPATPTPARAATPARHHPGGRGHPAAAADAQHARAHPPLPDEGGGGHAACGGGRRGGSGGDRCVRGGVLVCMWVCGSGCVCLWGGGRGGGCRRVGWGGGVGCAGASVCERVWVVGMCLCASVLRACRSVRLVVCAAGCARPM